MTNPNTRQNPQPPFNRQGARGANHSRSTKRVVNFVYYVIIGVLVSICLWSTIPYTELVHKGVSSIPVPFWISKPINFIPVIGGVIDALCRSAWVIVGILLWSFITLCELAPSYIRKDKAMLRLLIEESQGSQNIPEVEGEDKILQTLKRLYNHIPAHFLKRANQIAIVAYICDMLVCVQHYPICAGGVSRFNYLLATCQWEKFDLGNCTLLFLNLFLVEAIVRFLFHFFEMRYYVKRAHG